MGIVVRMDSKFKTYGIRTNARSLITSYLSYCEQYGSVLRKFRTS